MGPALGDRKKSGRRKLRYLTKKMESGKLNIRGIVPTNVLRVTNFFFKTNIFNSLFINTT